MVTRPRLLERLDQGALTIVHAAAGSGKTALAAAWAARRQAAGDLVRWADAPETTEQRRSLATAILAGGARGDWTKPSAIVLDGVDAPLGESTLSLLLETAEQNPRLRLVVLGRAALSIEGAARRAGVGTGILTTEDLLVWPAEFAVFAEAWGTSPDERLTAEIMQLTNGWLEPIRLLLAGTAAGALDVETATRWLGDLIERSGLPEDRLALLARLGLLHRLDEDTVGLALGEQSRGELPGELRDLGLLHVHRDDDGTRMHVPRLTALLLAARATAAHAELARAALRRDPARFETEILEHARRGEAWDVLARFWLLRGTQAVARLPEESWMAFGSVPDQLARRSTTLAIARYVATSSESPSRERASLIGFGHAETPTPNNLASYGSVDELIEAVVIRMVQLRAGGTVADAHELGLRAQHEVTRRRQQGAKPASPVNTGLFGLLRALTSLLVGNDWASASELAARAQQLTDGGDADFIVSSATGYRALLDALAGWETPLPETASAGLGAEVARAMSAIDALDRDAAAEAVERLWPHIADHEIWPYLAVAWGRYELIFGSAESLSEGVRELEWRHPAALGSPGAGRMALEALRLLSALKSGRANLAQRAIDEAGQFSPWLVIGGLRLRLATGEHSRALREALHAASDARLGNRDRAAALFIAAGSALELGTPEVAAEHFASARRIADANGLLGTYTMLGRTRRDRLFQLSGGGLDPERRARLDAVPDVYSDELSLVTLSARETEILRALAADDSHRELAAKLFISVATARSHIQALYGKLGVQNRAAALARAIELGLMTAAGDDAGE